MQPEQGTQDGVSRGTSAGTQGGMTEGSKIHFAQQASGGMGAGESSYGVPNPLITNSELYWRVEAVHDSDVAPEKIGTRLREVGIRVV